MRNDTTKMHEAIRLGCAAADIHLRCNYPACSCTQVPKAVIAAVRFAVRDVATSLEKAIVDGVKETFVTSNETSRTTHQR